MSGSAYRVDAGMVWIEGGEFNMGSDRHYPEERPVHRARVGGFWIDRNPVTNARYREFVDATGYVTVAERALDASQYPQRALRNRPPRCTSK